MTTKTLIQPRTGRQLYRAFDAVKAAVKALKDELRAQQKAELVATRRQDTLGTMTTANSTPRDIS